MGSTPKQTKRFVLGCPIAKWVYDLDSADVIVYGSTLAVESPGTSYQSVIIFLQVWFWDCCGKQVARLTPSERRCWQVYRAGTRNSKMEAALES